MKPYGYAWDPVCWISCLFYAANRWGLPAAWKGPFLRGHFNDCLFIPAALPLMLWLERAETPPLWVHSAIFLPLTVILAMAMIRPIKGATIGGMLKLGLTTPDMPPSNA